MREAALGQAVDQLDLDRGLDVPRLVLKTVARTDVDQHDTRRKAVRRAGG
jgi:hypothetical protein